MANHDLLTKDWKHLRGKARERWHSLTEDDLDTIAGNRTVLVSLLTEKYLYSEEIAQDEVDRFLDEMIKPQPTHV